MKIFNSVIFSCACLFQAYASHNNELASLEFDNALHGNNIVIPTYPPEIIAKQKEISRQHALIESATQNLINESVNSDDIIPMLELINTKNKDQDNLLNLVILVFRKQQIILKALYEKIMGQESINPKLIESTNTILEIIQQNKIIFNETYKNNCLFQAITLLANNNFKKIQKLLKAHHYISSFPSYITVNGCMVTVDKNAYIDNAEITYYNIISDIKTWCRNLCK